ncbi:inositol monophosphatase family protein [Rhizosaccharibacter radicis]|uniref:Inositol monophosphatase family protein n=1 Tax=Rhizosaccharibacter radicis TaxID=2782605 RepID=A0ABT1VXT4_9PROT|nr:inositol monophosphatase family protein [Acetobacteraceae bacterium KSS12]
MLDPVTRDRALQAAEAAVEVAGSVIRPFFRSGIATHTKDDRSPVTIADRTAERVMRAVLTERMPEAGILGEEFGLEQPEARLRWVLDPLDGTRAFITGRPTFGILLALLVDDEPVLGLIDQPVLRERWTGVAGRPTRFTGPFGGGTAGIATTRRGMALSEAELSCTAPGMMDDRTRPGFQRLEAAVRRSSWGGDCYGYGLLALGQIDVVAERDMKPWDWAALVPVVEGAGGRITDWSGRPLRADGDGSVLAVGDPALLAPCVACLSAAA